MQKELLGHLKKSNYNIPVSIGQILAQIPYEFRPGIGNIYANKKKDISRYEILNLFQRKEYIYNNFFKMFKYAYLNIPFYTHLYRSHGIELGDIKNFDSIKLVPIITKKDLNSISLEERSFKIKGRMLVNTGGSSGNPLSFYMDPIRFGNEWAHIHAMWSLLGYKPSSLKISFGGRSNIKKFIHYDFLRHSLRFDIYADKNQVCDELLKYVRKYKVEFLHGYPSAIYDFAIFCNENNKELLTILSKTLKGTFLSSEYPLPKYRDAIEDIFNIPSQSFYGHTETCVMAYEKEKKYKFNVFQTYGYAEAVNFCNSETNLIGTNYLNFASPLIRYNTEDSITPIDEGDGILKSFKIEGGRVGDFVLDRNERRIPLTGLIFGRHHKIFDYCKHVQVRQDYPGKCTILYVSDSLLSENIEFFFDSKNIDICFSFERITAPILTSSGKIKFLVK